MDRKLPKASDLKPMNVGNRSDDWDDETYQRGYRAGFLAARKRAVEVCNRLCDQAEESWRELDDEATYFRAAGMGECAAALERLGADEEA